MPIDGSRSWGFSKRTDLCEGVAKTPDVLKSACEAASGAKECPALRRSLLAAGSQKINIAAINLEEFRSKASGAIHLGLERRSVKA